MKKLILSTLTAAVVMSGMSSSFAAPETCNWGGYYANNECVWHDIQNDEKGSHTQCKVCKNGQWYDLYRCERRCFK